MLERIIALDQDFFLWLNQNLRISALDYPMFLISETWFWVPFYAFLLYLLYTVEKKRIFISVIFIALLVVSTDGVTSWVMKPYFKRDRPTHEVKIKEEVKVVKDWKGEEYRGGQYGFASGHSANSFGIAMFFFLAFRKKYKVAYFLFLWAALVAYSRIYLGVHYPLDILVGGMIGIFFGWLWRYFSILIQK